MVGLEEQEAQSLIIEAPRLKLVVGETVALRAEVRDGSGKRVPQDLVTWEALNPAVAALEGSAAGFRDLSARRAGTATIVVTSDDMTGSATFVVEQGRIQWGRMPAFLGAEGFGAERP